MPTNSFYCASRVRGCRQSPDCAGRLRITQTPCHCRCEYYCGIMVNVIFINIRSDICNDLFIQTCYTCQISFITFIVFVIITLRPKQNFSHFADDIFKLIVFNLNSVFLFKFQWFQGPIDNKPASVLILAWRRASEQILSDPMMV